MNCPRCEAPNAAGRRFCSECGLSLSVTCAACGFANEPGAKFCGGCSAPVAPASVIAASRFASPQSYTPKHLAEKILTSRSALEGERKQVTVLFVDVSGFTALAERLDPEDVHRVMGRAFEIMLTEVHRYEGTVNQFLGDGIMALFGAPIAHEDHVRRAIHAALGIGAALKVFHDDLERQQGVNFQVRQGLNTGLVVVGSIGSDLRMDYTAVGDTTNIAARLVQAAAPGQIVISDAVHRHIAGYFHTRSLGGLTLKGKTTPVAAWEIVAARAARTRLEVEAEQGLTRFVGRERELRTLLDAFERARAGGGQVVFITGDPGLGKSRLLFELHRALAGEVIWLEGHCQSFGHSIPFHPLIDLLKRQFAIDDGLTASTAAEHIDRAVLPLGEDLKDVVPYLGHLLGLTPADPTIVKMDPAQRRGKLFEGLQRVLRRAAERQPVVVVIEDLQLIDTASEEFLIFLAESVPTARILLVLTHRTGYSHRFGDRSYHARIGLSQLSRADSIRLGEAKLGVQSLSPDLEDLLTATAEGNPFFVEEVIKSLVEANVIRAVGRGYALAQPVQEIAVPNSIQSVIMARIDRLPDAPKKLLQLASVIGREFNRRILDRICEEPHAGEVLRELKRAELVYEKASASEPTFLFKHALTHDVAYSSLLMHRRRDVHRAIGRAIEDLYAERLSDHYDVLAYHYTRAEDTPKAVEYLLKAAAKAVSASANHEALGIYRQALAMLGDADGPRRAEVLKQLATVTSILADPEASLAYAEEALGLFETLGDKRGQVAMHLHIQVLYTWRWDGAREDKALGHLQAAAALVEDDADTAEKGAIYQRTGHLLLHRADPAGTLEWARKAVDLFSRLNLPIGTSLGTALTYTGQIDEGLAYNEGNADGVFRTKNPLVMGVWGHEMVLTLALVRDLGRARRWGERILPEVSKDTPVFEAMIRRPLGLIYTLAGDVAKAEETCRAVALIENKTLLGCIFEDSIAIAFHALRRGDWDDAQEYLESRIPVFQDRNNLAARGACTFALGLVHAERGQFAAAEDLVRRSLTFAGSGNNVLFQLWILPVLCELHVKMQKLADAADDLERVAGLVKSEQGRYGLVAPLLKARGVLAAARREWETAAEAFQASIAVNRQYGLPYEEAEAWYEWGLMDLARGQREAARAKLGQAMTLFQQAGAARAVARTLAAGH